MKAVTCDVDIPVSPANAR